jgi:hypothetical protein
MGWLVARIFLPFPLSAGILLTLPVVLNASLPTPFRFWAWLTYWGGTALGLGAMVGLLLAREPRLRQLTLTAAGIAAALLSLTYLIAGDPFCWRGYEGADGDCAWE